MRRVGLLTAVALMLINGGAARADERRVDICHVPSGNPAEARMISVAPSSVEKHLAHGDDLGACCPCWVSGNRLEGIDFEVQELASTLCAVGPDGAVASGFRSIEPIQESWAVKATDTCILIDEANEIETKVEELSSEESAACLESLLKSSMWALNCEADSTGLVLGGS